MKVLAALEDQKRLLVAISGQQEAWRCLLAHSLPNRTIEVERVVWNEPPPI